LPFRRGEARLARGGAVKVFDLEQGGVRMTMFPTASSRAERAPSREEGALFLDLADQVLERFAPRVLLTYGGHPAILALMARARRRGIAVVFRLTRVLLIPSLWRESFGRVAAEGLANGLPILASDRGALPEVLGDAGIVLTIPERCTPASAVVPTPRQVAPWVAAIEKLWDDPEFECWHRAVARDEARRWDDDRLFDEYERFFRSVAN
jgi:glycosyltransferase involved in cell wall biosynthesis